MLFFERPDKGELAVLVHVDVTKHRERQDGQEFEHLALSSGVQPAVLLTGTRQWPDPKYFVGSGKLAEIRETLEAQGAQLVLFNNPLSPSQERNLESALGCRVIDRTGLILDIFAQRARTFEGKLQVELAQLEHLSTRLVRGWTHLERQRGGIGTRGPGETQLETDRRLIRSRIKTLRNRLDKVRRQREQGRRARERAETATVSLVGYTNAGKSTLFNRLTGAEVFVENQLFATLDPTLRRLELPDVGYAILADTVGFIRHLPHQLVEAFKATLEESVRADLLLHVIDASDDERDAHREQVEAVLAAIDAGEVPRLEVWNKIDRAGGREPGTIERDDDGLAARVFVSAAEGTGLEALKAALSERLGDDVAHEWLQLKPSWGQLRGWLYDDNAVLSEEADAAGNMLTEVRLPRWRLDQFLKRLALTPDEVLGAGSESRAEAMKPSR